MATPASSQRPVNAPIGPSATWARSGEPGTAFNGLSRGRSRGAGRGRGSRGGRGAPRDTKPTGTDSTGDRPSTATKAAAPTPVAKPVALPPPVTSDKPTVPSGAPNSNRSRGGGSRRSSRAAPVLVVPPQLNGSADIPSSPNPRAANRRRRSQSGKPAPPLAKLTVPPNDDNLLRPPRHRTGQVPHTAPIKDAPPHLLGSTFDIRNNIDALVERVRAVAMADNRPTTPGSHIDWAGDDDDTLPDLDDWGVVPAAEAVDKDTISPLVVEGIRSLPDVLVDTHISPSSPESPDPSSAPLLNIPVSNASEADEQKLQSLGPRLNKLDSGQSRDMFLWKNMPINTTKDDAHIVTPITMTQEPFLSAPATAKVSLHPSLPARPLVSIPSNHLSPRQFVPTPIVTEGNTSHIVTQITHDIIPNEDSTRSVQKTMSEPGLADSIHAPPLHVTNIDDVFTAILVHDGLGASIHAPIPSGISESKSAPSHISTHTPPDLSSISPSSVTPEYRTHTRAHTVGRPPSFPRQTNNNRPSRSGYTTPRGGLSLGAGGGHTRTHSTPPTGTHNNRGPHAHRPVITGDALSRLARSIGSVTPSSGRPVTVAGAHD